MAVVQDEVVQKVLLADQPTKQFVGVDEVSPSLPGLLVWGGALPACNEFLLPADRGNRHLQLQQGDRMCPAVQVGALVRHLCGDDARSFTGACISIDGGWTAR